jgi:heat shock protein HslJ
MRALSNLLIAVALALALTATPQTKADLVGPTWSLATLNGKKPDKQRSNAHIIFKPKGKMTGNTGLNSFSATYRLKGSTIKITLGMQTLVGGSPEVMKRENDFKGALTSATSYRLRGGTLELKKGAKVLAVFKRG